MHIGSIILAHPTVLAPLAGITDLPFRLVVKRLGCGMVCSEMISANALVRNSQKTRAMLDTTAEEYPLSVQLFGADPAVMADAAALVAESGAAAVIDINFGCSVKKVVKTGAGAALMRDPQRARALLRAVRKAVTTPITIKIRSGWDPSGDQALEIARIGRDEGVNAIAVHPRTATQGFSGKADWRIIARIQQAIDIPVIGNGDILRAEDALAMMEQTRCDAVMVGRAAMGNPWIFDQIHRKLTGEPELPISLSDRKDLMAAYVRTVVAYRGERHGCRMLRSRLGWFSRGMRNGAAFREAIRRLETEAQAIDIIRSIL
ncbi:MAG: tRNA dihydrouridine synthase DusB [Thermodesulfobacteriota bacterium]